MRGKSQDLPRDTSQPVCQAECYISESRYLDLIKEMCMRIGLLKPIPDCFVGVKRSGLFPAVFLSHQLSRPMLVDSETKNFPTSKFSHAAIIDTTCWNGRSLRTIRNRLLKRGVSRISTVVMIARENPPPNIPELIYLETATTVPRFWYEQPG